jgi:hypothetical protein
MVYRLLSDFIVIAHFLYILFVITGALIALRWKKIIWLHIPAVIWGATVEYTGWICPLTPWENRFRMLAGEEVYHGDFIGNYILPVIYPEEVTRNIQIVLGTIVIIVNIMLYGIIINRSVKGKN